MNTSAKQVLIISPFFHPEPISTGKINTELVLEISKKVKRVNVLCFHPFYPNWKIRFTKEKLDTINIVRGGEYIRFTKNATLRRIILELSFALFVFRKYFKLKKDTDILIPVFPPSLAFYLIKGLNRKNKKIVTIVHDLQHIYSSRKRGLLNRFLSYFIKFIEKENFKKSDKIIFFSNEMKRTAISLYGLNPSKLKTLYPFITLKNESTNDLEKILPKRHEHIVYAGALGEKQNPYKLYSFFNFASGNIDNTYFHFFSSGMIYKDLKRKNRNEKIKFHPLVNEKNLKELYMRSTIQIIPQLPGTSIGSLPSKLPNILASGTKVLAITDHNSEIDKIFKSHELKGTVNSWDFKLLLSKLEELMHSNFNENFKQQAIANKLFNIELLIDEILS